MPFEYLFVLSEHVLYMYMYMNLSTNIEPFYFMVRTKELMLMYY